MKITKIKEPIASEVASTGDYKVEGKGYLVMRGEQWVFIMMHFATKVTQAELYKIADKLRALNQADRSRRIRKAVNQVVSQRNKPYSDPTPAY